MQRSFYTVAGRMTLKHHLKKEVSNVCTEEVVCTFSLPMSLFSPPPPPFPLHVCSSAGRRAFGQISRPAASCVLKLSCLLARPCWTSPRRPLAAPSHQVGSSHVALKCWVSWAAEDGDTEWLYYIYIYIYFCRSDAELWNSARQMIICSYILCVSASHVRIKKRPFDFEL